MTKSIVYIQSNEKVAASFQETFRAREIELLVAPTAQEAIRLMREQEVGLLLIDINIPDMRLSKLVEICTKEFPMVMLNVCVDVISPLLMTKLVNRHGIHKVFVAPWDVKEMIDEIEESLDSAQISREQRMQEGELLKKNDDFKQTLDSLTSALKKQQFSYNKISHLTDIMFDIYKEQVDGNKQEQEFQQVREYFETYLRMQTTDSIDVERFDEVIAHDLRKIKKKYQGIVFGDVKSCLKGRVPKVCAADIRFLLWMLAEYSAQTRNVCTYKVTSQLLSDSAAKFNVTVKGKITEEFPFGKRLVEELLQSIAENVSIEHNGDKTEYTIEARLVTA